MTRSIGFNILDQEIAHTYFKEPRCEQGKGEKAGPWTGEIDLRGGLSGESKGVGA